MTAPLHPTTPQVLEGGDKLEIGAAAAALRVALAGESPTAAAALVKGLNVEVGLLACFLVTRWQMLGY